MNSISSSFVNIPTTNYATSAPVASGVGNVAEEQSSISTADGFVRSSSDDEQLKLSSDLKSASVSSVDTKKKSEPVTITIISTNDMHGKLDKMPKVAGVLDALKAQYPDAIVIDGGDSSYNPPFSTGHRFEPVTQVLNEMPYDIIGLGNHEFQYGKGATVSEFVNKVNADVIAGNVHADYVGGYLEGVKPYVVKDVGGVKVAFVSMLEPKMHTKPNPHVGKDLVKEMPVDAMKRLMPELQANADIIIGVNHQGLNDDKALAKAVDGITAIFSSHDHALTETPIQVGSYPNSTYIVESGSHCKLVGLTQITVDPDTKEVLDFQFTNYPVQTFNCKPNERVEQIVKPYIRHEK
jgi:2',3'-cyclic-nucleotide 2'-phosphodiesterase (5'-nucleotidase family)